MTERREYGLISKRSRQILGEEVLPKQSGCTAQKNAESNDSNRRRTQVLQAQRTHRQRTQTYIKMLEREVLKLRESERAALDRVQGLQKEVDGLLRILARTGSSLVTPPSNNAVSNSHDHHPQGIVTATVGGTRGVYVNVEFPRSPTKGDESQVSVSPATTRGSDDGVGHGSWEHDSNVSTATPLSVDSVLGTSTPPNPSRAFLSDPRVAIEFVLTLETDCMDHLRGKHLDHVHNDIIDSESEFSGHMSTACLSLWQQRTTNISSDSSYEISNSELDRLLSSSLNLGLAPPEITPVQIWNRIRWLEFPGGRETLENFTKELREQVYCLGFGAVLHDKVVEGILKRYFSQLPPLY